MNLYVLIYAVVLIGAAVVAFRGSAPTPPDRTLAEQDADAGHHDELA